MKFSSVEMIERKGKKFILKTAEESERQVTLDQIEYLKKLPTNIRDTFPKIEETFISEDKVAYLMPYYDMNHLSETIERRDVDVHVVNKVIETILRFMFDNVYCLNHKAVISGFVDEVYVKRMLRRTQLFLNECPQIEPLISSEFLVINGKRCTNLRGLLHKLDSMGLKELLSPQYVSMIHGDLETNHILYRENSEHVDIMLLDPRPNVNGGDFSYDLAKLYQSIDGMVNVIESGRFSLDIKYRETPQIDFHMNPNRNEEEYHFLRYSFNAMVSKIAEENDIKYLLERITFAEASHFISAPPFYFENNVDVAIALYIKGIMIFNELLEKICVWV